MFDKLDDLLIRYEEIMNELSEPGVADNQDRFRRLMKEQNDLAPIVEAYKEYKANNQAIEDSLAMLEEGDRRGDEGAGQGRVKRIQGQGGGTGAEAEDPSPPQGPQR